MLKSFHHLISAKAMPQGKLPAEIRAATLLDCVSIITTSLARPTVAPDRCHPLIQTEEQVLAEIRKQFQVRSVEKLSHWT